MFLISSKLISEYNIKSLKTAKTSKSKRRYFILRKWLTRKKLAFNEKAINVLF